MSPCRPYGDRAEGTGTAWIQGAGPGRLAAWEGGERREAEALGASRANSALPSTGTTVVICVFARANTPPMIPLRPSK